MKKLIYLLFLACSIAFGQITHSSSPTAVSAAGVTSLGISFTIASGDTLAAVSFTVDSSSDIVSSVTDSQGANWTLGNKVNAGIAWVYVYYSNDLSTTGSRTVTVNISSSSNIALSGVVFKGTVTSSPVDHSATNNSSGAISLTFSATNSDSVIVFGMGTAQNDSFGTYGSGQVEFGNVAQGGSPSNRVSNAGTYEIVTASGSNNQTAADPGNSWGCVGVEFLADATPPAPRRIFVIN